MTPTYSKPANGENPVRRRRLNAPIHLERPDKVELEKGQYVVLKLRTNPADEKSTTYDLPLPFYSTGTPEEWLRFKLNLSKVLIGQNITTGPPKYALARRVLEGDALAAFEAAAALQDTETVLLLQLSMSSLHDLHRHRNAT